MANPGSTCWDSTSTPTPGCSSRIRCAATMPSSVLVGGMRMSTIAQSGFCVATAHQAVDVSGLRDTSTGAASTRAIPSRVSITSSAMTTRMRRVWRLRSVPATGPVQGWHR